MKNNLSPAKKIDVYTHSLFDLVLQIAQTAQKYDKQYFIGGGVAIDLSLGKITRNHHDIDFHPLLEDFDWWKRWFKKQGYTTEEPADEDFEETCHVLNLNGDNVVDLWPMKLINGKAFCKYKGKYTNTSRYWHETRLVVFENTKINVENPKRILEQKIRQAKKGKQLRPQDLHDFTVLGFRPEEF